MSLFVRALKAYWPIPGQAKICSTSTLPETRYPKTSPVTVKVAPATGLEIAEADRPD